MSTAPNPQQTNDQLFAAAQAVIPGGVDSPVRAYGSVGGTPPFIRRAHGPYVVDEEGTRRIDLVASWGPMLLGHAFAPAVTAVQEAAARGLSFGAPTASETDLAAEVVSRVPGVEKVRFVSTGTEATMTALRLARAVSGRDVIVKFAGLYHGHSDALLAQAGSGLATGGLPASAGVSAQVSAQTIVLPYNDPQALTELFAARGHEIAAVIVEGAAANMGVVAPREGFYPLLRRLTREHGALLIMDEVLTGFRVSPGGWFGLHTGQQGERFAIDTVDVGDHGAGAGRAGAGSGTGRAGTAAQGTYGGAGAPVIESYQPDIFTFGKVVGGGMPLAALGASASIMDQLAPLGPVYQAGTLSGNPLSTAAGLATLRAATPAVYAQVDRAADMLCQAAADAFAAASLPVWIGRAGSLFSFFFSETPVVDYAGAGAAETWRYRPFFWSLFEAGIYAPPSVFEAWFLGAAHDDAVLNQICEAFGPAARAAAAAKKPA